MKKLFIVLLALGTLGAAQAAPGAKSSQATPKAVPSVEPAGSADADPASVAEVNELLVLLKSREQMETVMQGMKEQMNRGQMQGFEMALQKKGITLTAEEKARARVRLDAITEEIFKQMPFEEMMASIAEIYRKHFSSGDVQALIGFYRSPTGQKFLKEMPTLMQESMRAGGDIMSKRMPQILEGVDKRVQELSEEFAKNLPAAKQ